MLELLQARRVCFHLRARCSNDQHHPTAKPSSDLYWRLIPSEHTYDSWDSHEGFSGRHRAQMENDRDLYTSADQLKSWIEHRVEHKGPTSSKPEL
jgi:hypothetical protein